MASSPVLIPREFWRRFLDDIFLLWTNTRHELDDFILHINSFHPSIKFTVNSSPVSLPFLDINISLRDGYLHTDLHTKATDAHGYLHRRSCHLPHVYKNIPSSQFLRVRRLCSDPETFKKRSKDIEASLLSRGYDIKSLKQASEKALVTPRSEMLTYKVKLGHKRPPMEVTHNPWDPYLNKDIDSMEKTQRIAAPFITGDFRSNTPDSATRLLERTGLPPLQQRRQHLRLALFFTVVEGLVAALPPQDFLQPQKQGAGTTSSRFSPTPETRTPYQTCNQK